MQDASIPWYIITLSHRIITNKAKRYEYYVQCTHVRELYYYNTKRVYYYYYTVQRKRFKQKKCLKIYERYININIER